TRIECLAPHGTTVARRGLPPGTFDEDAAHGLRGGGEEVAAAVPPLAVRGSDQPQVCLVNEGGRLKRLARRLGGQARGGEAAQLVVNRRQQLSCGVRVALLDGVQDLRDVTHTSPRTKRLFLSEEMTQQ